MALGIGANVAMFTVVRSVLLKPLPFQDPDRLVRVFEHTNDTEFSFNIVAGGVYAEWRKQSRGFSDLALLGEAQFNLTGDGGQLPEIVHGTNCTWNLFSTLGPAELGVVEAALRGRFSYSEPDDPPEFAQLHRHRRHATLVCLSRLRHATLDTGLSRKAGSSDEFLAGS
jgi:hypothetical protein